MLVVCSGGVVLIRFGVECMLSMPRYAMMCNAMLVILTCCIVIRLAI